MLAPINGSPGLARAAPFSLGRLRSPLPQGRVGQNTTIVAVQNRERRHRAPADCCGPTAAGFLLLYPAAPEIRSAANGILFFSRAIKEQN